MTTNPIQISIDKLDQFVGREACIFDYSLRFGATGKLSRDDIGIYVDDPNCSVRIRATSSTDITVGSLRYILV